MNNLSKRLTVIISIIVMIIIIVIMIIFSGNGNKNNTTNTSTDNTTNTSDSYNIDPDLQFAVSFIEPAVINYLQQDISESKESRNNRLSQYFLADSPVYNYEQQNINNAVPKSSSKITAIRDGAQQDDITVYIDVDTTMFLSKSTSIKLQTFWVTYRRDSGGNLKAYDIGEDIW